MSVFNKYSRYYNLLYRDKDYAGEAEYVHELIRKYSPDAKSLLDLGCGTGRHAFPLAKKGYSVTGVDISEEMLAVANSQLSSLNPQPSALIPHPSILNFIHGDIRTIRLGIQFDVVVSLFHVMSYQATNDDIRAAFDTVSIHLKDGGLFIFDFWYGPAVLTDRPEVRVKRLEDQELSVCRTATPAMHLNENVVNVNYEVEIGDKKTGMLERIKETHRMRYFFLPELEFMLEAAGFSVAAELAWMSMDKRPGEDSWYGLMIARK